MSERVTMNGPRARAAVEARRRARLERQRSENAIQEERSKSAAANWAELKRRRAGEDPNRPRAPKAPADRNLAYMLPDGAWKGQRCFIIGGGPSLKGFDFSRLFGERVIAVNRAYEACPTADIMLAMDRRVYNMITEGRLGEDAKRKFEEFKGLKVWMRDVPGAMLLRDAGGTGLTKTLRDGVCNGNNTGYAALNLAICLGADPIYLLGFDMKGDGQGHQAWFHTGYQAEQGESVYKKFIGAFEKAAPEIKQRGVRVINLNPESALKAFEFGRVDEVLPKREGEAFFNGCLGFGDNFQQRPIIREMLRHSQTVYVRTALPEAYWDMPGVRFVHPGPINLSSQRKHMESLPKGTFLDSAPAGAPARSWRQEWPVQTAGAPGISISKHIKDNLKIENYDFTFPLKGEWIAAARRFMAGLNTHGKKLCIIRRPVERTEFNCPARNPKTEYFQLLIDRYKSEYFFLSLGALEEGREWYAGELTGIDAALDHGELPLTTIFALVSMADMTITTPGFFMPMAIALRARAFVIFGGHTAPEIHINPVMGTEMLGWAAPEPFCRCLNNVHDCKKDIPEARLIGAFEELKNRKREPAKWESLNRPALTPPPVADNEEPRIPEDIFFTGMYGFGDNLNQRPVIRHLAEKYRTVYLKTTVPEFYWDIPNVRFVFPDGVSVQHHSHAKHVFTIPLTTYDEKPADATPMRWHFKFQRIADEKTGEIKFYEEDQAGVAHEVPPPAEVLSIPEDERRRAGIPKDKYDYQLPVKREWIEAATNTLRGLQTQNKKICVVGPPTIREEWPCAARNPKAEYLQLIVDKYKDEYFFISLANLEEGKERLDGEITGIDAEFHHGELPLTTIIGLLKIADMTLTPPAWLLNLAIAVRAKVFTIFGGHAGPEFLLDPIQGLENVAWVAPRPFCNCWRLGHDCRKDIPKDEVLAKFEDLRARPKKLKEVTMGFPPGIGDVHWPAMILESFKERRGIDRLIVKFKEEWKYTSAFLQALPFIDEVRTNDTNLPFSFSLAGGHGRPLYVGKAGLDYMIDYGSSLERGVTFENVMPEYEVNWDYEIRGLEKYDAYCADLRRRCGGRLVVIYTSSLGGNQHWARTDWTLQDWMELARMIHRENGCKVVIVGMGFDHSYAVELKKLDVDDILIDLTGQTEILNTLAIIRAADLFMGFSCGLDMLAVKFRTPTVEFWPIKGISQGGVYSPAFMHSWLPPWARNSDAYIPVVYGPESRPELIFPKIRKFL